MVKHVSDPSKNLQPLWEEEDDNCCRRLTPAEHKPEFKMIDSRIYSDGEGSFMDCTFEIVHRCGLRTQPKVRFQATTGESWRPVVPLSLEVGSAADEPGVRYTAIRFPVLYRRVRHPVRVNITAISKCGTRLATRRML